MPTWLAVILLGIIEGITEFLPISSTGHLLLAERWLKVHCSDLFIIVIQSGAVLAVLPLFHNRLRQFAFQWWEKPTQLYAGKIALAFLVTAVGGVIMDRFDFQLPETIGPIAWALFLGGIGFLVVERWLRDKQQAAEVTWAIALAVGVAQLVAAGFPGTSRSGATILIALVLGLNRVAATEFTFLVGIPTMLAAGGWKIVKQLTAGAGPQEDWDMVALGFVVSGVVSFAAVKWLLGYIQTHTFVVFGWYRILLAAILAGLIFTGTAPAPRELPHSPESNSPAVSSLTP